MEATVRPEQRRDQLAVDEDDGSEGEDDDPDETVICLSNLTTSASISLELLPIALRVARRMIAIPRHGSSFLLRRYASRIRRFRRFRTTAFPSRFPAAIPTRFTSGAGRSWIQVALTYRPEIRAPS